MARNRIGRHQRLIRRLFIIADGEAIPTSTMMGTCCRDRDKLERWRWNIVARAAHRFGVNVRRGWWRANDELLRQIKGET
jgi:hypothetical protein